MSAHETGCGLRFLPTALNQVGVCVCVCAVRRVDSDYYKVSVGAAAEGGRVLPPVSEPRVQLPPAGHALRRGHGHEAVGIQREASHVYVSGQFSFGNLRSGLEVIHKIPRLHCGPTFGFLSSGWDAGQTRVSDLGAGVF